MSVMVIGDHEERTIQQLERCVRAEEGAAGVLCADGHVGYSQPVGGAVAYREHISVSGVGYDIGCGNKAVRTELQREDIAADLPRIMDAIVARISFGVGRHNNEPVDHPVLDAIRTADAAPQRALREVAAKQLGTVGAGNHYVDLFADEDGVVWIGVHFGSRGFGHKTATTYLELAGQPGDGMDAPPTLLAVGSELGQEYIAAMQLAGDYAYAGRDIVCDRVLDILGAAETFSVHNHHNFCVAGDQIVPTTLGPRRMDEINPGQVVYAFDPGRGPVRTRVVDHWCSGKREIYTISLGVRRIRCSGSHPLLVVDDGLRWRRADEIRPGEIVVCAEGYYEETSDWSAEKARLVGAFLGDGWLRHDPHRQGYSLGLAIGTGAERHTHRYAELATAELPNHGWGRGWRIDAPGHYGLSCSSKSAWGAALDMGLYERSRHTGVPGSAFNLPREAKLALLAGYFDADGSVADGRTSNHGRGTIASVSEDLVKGLRELAIGCGLHVTSVRSERRQTNFGDCVVYRCTVAADSTAILELWHEKKAANQRLTRYRRGAGLAPRHLGAVELPPGAFARRVVSIEIGPPEAVYDLTVDHSSHSFIVEGVVTHNCWREVHDGEEWWVVRKGCTPAFPGQQGFVGSTMGETSVILEGADTPAARAAFFSTVHGAGRRLSRTQAAGKMGVVFECSVRDCDFWVPRSRKGERCPLHPDARMLKRRRRVKPGLIDYEQVRADLRARGIELRGGAADEAPDAYKRLDEVLSEHGDSIRVLHRLTPIGVAMAGPDIVDPYKD